MIIGIGLNQFHMLSEEHISNFLLFYSNYVGKSGEKDYFHWWTFEPPANAAHQGGISCADLLATQKSISGYIFFSFPTFVYII